MLVVHRVSGPDAWSFISAAVAQFHRHHAPPQGWKWGYIATRGGRIVGVATIGRAVGRWGRPMLELTRGCTWSRARYGAASAMLQAAARDCGHRGLVTYTLASEPGESLRAAGWLKDGPVQVPRLCRPGGHRSSRRRPDQGQAKQRWRPGAEPTQVTHA